MTRWKGYGGNILRVNLSSGKIKTSALPDSLAEQYMGGTGFCAKILWDEVTPDIDPFGPDNKLIMAVGPLTGTFFPPSGRYLFVAKSPQTMAWGESHSGGHLGPEFKFAGYDMLIIEGRAKKPVYLFIDNGDVELRDASKLWGTETGETTNRIREEANDETVEVACIGPSGEQLVRFACIITDYYRAAGRSGMGAVMGSKRLKAIAVRGTKGVDVADPDAYQEIIDEAFNMCTTGKWGEASKASLGTFGTTNLVPLMNQIGRFPTKNHWTGVFDGAEKIGPVLIREKYRVGIDSCYGCALQCKYISQVKSGKYKGTISGGPEYETIMAFGSNLLIDDVEAVFHANMLCNKYGLDTISTGKLISFVMECYEHNILTDEDMEGVEPTWGNTDAMVELIHRIASRKGKMGKLLGEGVRIASEGIGRGSEKYAIQGKGLEASGQDGRAHKSVGLTYAISVRGYDHLRSLCTVDELGYRDIAAERFGAKNVDDICDLLTETNKGMIVKDQEDLFAIVDSLIICKYGAMWPPIYYFPFLSRVITPLTGMKDYTEKDMRLTAERIANLRRCFNTREGLTRKDEGLHPRFTKEPMPHGPAKGEVVNLKPMLDQYYSLRGWDKETGLPKESTLKRVGLKDVAEELKQKGKVR